MSGSENGQEAVNRDGVSTGRVLGARSASPAKRTAADMEGHSRGHAAAVPGSFSTAASADQPSDFDEAMKSMDETQDTNSTSLDTSAQSSIMTSENAASSLDHEKLPGYSIEDPLQAQAAASLPSFDEQYAQVYASTQKQEHEGDRGVVFSLRWLTRVMSRTSDGLKNAKYPKHSREGPVGPVDNSDLVPEGAFDAKNILYDVDNQGFVPLKPGLQLGTDFEVLPFELWDLIVGWYGCGQGQKPIVRYARDTAPPEANTTNMMYELYPPVFTIRKVAQTGQQANEQADRPQPTKTLEALRLRQEQSKRGQRSADDAIRFVSSRTERFVPFLRRCKEATNIPMEHKVKIWRKLDSTQVSTEKPATRPPSPPPSRNTSPHADGSQVKLLVTTDEWQKMDIGSDIEHVDVPDDTGNNKYNGKSTIDTFALVQDQTLILEPQVTGPAGGEFLSDSKRKPVKKSFLNDKNKLGSVTGSAASSRAVSPAPGGMMTRGRARRDGKIRGTVGLTNLGNTCYMNSALQCVRSVEELAIYFLSSAYKKEINASNPLGHGGAVAKQYAGVLEAIYSDKSVGSFSPSNFKRTLGQFAPMFSGYGQQDSQEFLSFLVDAIHEDLNRIIKKPYMENPESDDKTVHDPQAIIELGEKFRSNHKARNDSVAMDLFNGFYKNTMECPECDKVSVTFDPYSLVTVQLPIENTFQHVVSFVPLRGRPVNYLVDIDKNQPIRAVKEYIASRQAGVDAKRLWMVEVYQHKVYRYLEDQMSLAEANIQPHDYIFCFELDDIPTNIPSPNKKRSTFYSGISSRSDDEIPDMESPMADRIAVPVFSREKSTFSSSYRLTKHPMYVIITRDEAQDYDVILKKVLSRMAQLTSRPILTEFRDEDDASKEDIHQQNSSSGDGDKVENGSDDSARVSDRSVPSEDGYVDVSLASKLRTSTESPETDLNDEAQMSGVEPATDANQRPTVPPGFMDPTYPLSDALRNQLFAMNYARSAEGMLCTGMTCFHDNTVSPMDARVKKPARRTSVQSTASDYTLASTVSGHVDANDDAEDDEATDVEDEATPSLTTAGSPAPGPTSEDELADNPIETAVKDFRRAGRGKLNKYGRRSKHTFSKKDRGTLSRPTSRGFLDASRSHKHFGGKSLPNDENPFYIKLGEAIVLDWYPEAFTALFGGDGLEGTYLSSDEGKDLELIEDPETKARIDARKERKTKGVTLEDCFNETGKREVLSEDNAWYCNRCKELRRATKTLEIWTAPDILVVHLKRFGGNRSFRDKVEVMVNYPIEGLDLTGKVGMKEDGKEYVYDLFAVDNHYGGLGGGHYTALAKNFYDGQWYDYNDSMVSKVGEGSAKLRSASAYLLFYRRRSDKPLGPPYLQELVESFRNPPEAYDGINDSAAEDSDSGEGRLGDPTSRLLGSSSAGKAGVGAGAGSHQTLRGGAGGPGAGSSLRQETLIASQSPRDDVDEGIEMDDNQGHGVGTLNGKTLYGPQRPSHLQQYGNQGDTSWSFANLDAGAGPDAAATDDDPPANFLHSIEGPGTAVDHHHNNNDAASSTGADFNTPSPSSAFQRSSPMLGFDDDDDDDTDINTDHDTEVLQFQTSWDSGAGVSSNISHDQEADMGGYYDRHDMYSSAHERGDALHLEDAGSLGEDGDGDSQETLRSQDSQDRVG